MLSITDHAFRRFAEYQKGFTINIPKHKTICLTHDMAKKVKASAMALLGVFTDSKKVVPPENYFMGKFLKYGAVDNRFFQVTRGICYAIIHEPKVATIVTVSKPDPKKSKPWPVDVEIPNPYGALYLKEVDSVGVPYDLKIGVDYVTMVKILPNVNVPLRFGVRS